MKLHLPGRWIGGKLKLDKVPAVTTIERPVFILAPPRSGSTLLFETLNRCAGLWSLGDEGHGIIERHPRLRPRPFSEDCNRLLAGDLSDELGREIRNDFLNQIQDNNERKLSDRRCPSVRLIEKTPKNILRIPFILRLFPDACFIYLYRDARENISSIMEGWSSGRFTTYMDKPTRHGLWSFLLPPGWHRHTQDTLAEIAAFQWSACHEFAMQDLLALQPDRWCALNYAEFLTHTEPVVERLCQFMAVPMDDGLRRHCRESLPLSRYTLSAPAADKWRQQAQALAPLMPGAAALCNRINNFTAGYSTPLATELAIDLSKVGQGRKIGRNEPCPCGSGSKYKHCHGRI